MNVIKRNVYHLQLNETVTMLGVFVKRSQNKRYFLRIREASKKESDFHNENLSKVAKKYKVKKRKVNDIRNSQVFVRTKLMDYVILTSKLYVVRKPNITHIAEKKSIPEAKVRRAFERYRKKKQRKELFQELKSLDKKIEYKKLVSENTRELEKHRDELLMKLNLEEQRSGRRSPRRSNKYVPQRVKSRASHYK